MTTWETGGPHLVSHPHEVRRWPGTICIQDKDRGNNQTAGGSNDCRDRFPAIADPVEQAHRKRAEDICLGGIAQSAYKHHQPVEPPAADGLERPRDFEVDIEIRLFARRKG